MKNISPVLAFLNRWTQVALKRMFPLDTITEICTITILFRLHPGKVKLGMANGKDAKFRITSLHATHRSVSCLYIQQETRKLSIHADTGDKYRAKP